MWFRGKVNTTEVEEIRYELTYFRTKVWGFHIYRCAYASPPEWSRFMALLHRTARENLTQRQRPNDEGTDLLDSLALTVHEDPVALAGESIDHVRVLFRDWVASEEAAKEQEGARGKNLVPRYTYCVHVDQESLDSMTSDHPYVNLIDTDWGVALAEEEQSPDPDEYQEFWGKDDEGWPGSMKVAADQLLPGAYARFQDKNVWWSDSIDPYNIWGDPYSGKKFGGGLTLPEGLRGRNSVG